MTDRPSSGLRSYPRARYWVALFSLLTAPLAGASTLTQALLACEPVFFHELDQHRDALEPVVALGHDSQIAWIAVPDRSAEDRASTFFSRPVADGPLHLSGFFDHYSHLGAAGSYYYWGFYINESLEQIMATTPQAHWVHSGTEYASNPLIKFSSREPWQANATAVSGIAPARGSIEKLVLLEQRKGRSLLTCSVQGSVDGVVMDEERPDLVRRPQP